jgi:hypothetical protein
MSLQTRVLKLEKLAVNPFKPVQVIFQQADESDEKIVSQANLAIQNDEWNVIVVKFVEPNKG